MLKFRQMWTCNLAATPQVLAKLLAPGTQSTLEGLHLARRKEMDHGEQLVKKMDRCLGDLWPWPSVEITERLSNSLSDPPAFSRMLYLRPEAE